MIRQIIGCFLLAGCILSIGCFSNKEVKKEESQEVPDTHTSRNSLDWPGSYVGVISDSVQGSLFYGIRLTENQDYELKKSYLGINRSTEEYIGKFSWTKDDSYVELGETEIFQVQEFRLVQEWISLISDSESNSNQKYIFPQVDVGPLADAEPSELIGDWKVYKRFRKDGEWTDETFSHLSFTADGKIRGKAACNAYHGTFSVPATQRLKLSPISSTKMSCPKLSAEKAYFDALNKATYYFTFGEYLILISEDLTPLILAVGIVK